MSRHEWDRDGERCVKCGDKDWMGGPCSVESLTPQAQPERKLMAETQCCENGNFYDGHECMKQQAQPDEQDWNKAFQAQVVIGAQLEAQLAECRRERDEHIEHREHFADLLKEACNIEIPALKAERDKYKLALERVLECDKGKWYDVTHVVNEALGLDEKEEQK